MNYLVIDESDPLWPIKKNLFLAIFLIAILYVVGIVFYTNIEGWGFLDSALFLTATFTTIGYGEILPRTAIGKVFTIILAWVGISTGFFLLYSLAAYREKVVDKNLLQRLKVLKNIMGKEENRIINLKKKWVKPRGK